MTLSHAARKAWPSLAAALITIFAVGGADPRIAWFLAPGFILTLTTLIGALALTATSPPPAITRPPVNWQHVAAVEKEIWGKPFHHDDVPCHCRDCDKKKQKVAPPATRDLVLGTRGTIRDVPSPDTLGRALRDSMTSMRDIDNALTRLENTVKGRRDPLADAITEVNSRACTDCGQSRYGLRPGQLCGPCQQADRTWRELERNRLGGLLTQGRRCQRCGSPATLFITAPRPYQQPGAYCAACAQGRQAHDCATPGCPFPRLTSSSLCLSCEHARKRQQAQPRNWEQARAATHGTPPVTLGYVTTVGTTTITSIVSDHPMCACGGTALLIHADSATGRAVTRCATCKAVQP